MNSSANPRHIAAIMDGNTRWARHNKVSVTEGYRKGVESAWEFVLACIAHGVEYVTLYTFSLDNWKRDHEMVVNPLMNLLESSLSEKSRVMEHDIKVDFIGELEVLPPKVQETISSLEHCTRSNSGLILAVALSYGAREEILAAVKSVIKQNIPAEQLTEELFASELYTGDRPAPDLLIRTGGEKRLSNFLLWQLSYTELYFCEKLWPDFSNADLEAAILDYGKRERRYGRL